MKKDKLSKINAGICIALLLLLTAVANAKEAGVSSSGLVNYDTSPYIAECSKLNKLSVNLSSPAPDGWPRGWRPTESINISLRLKSTNAKSNKFYCTYESSVRGYISMDAGTNITNTTSAGGGSSNAGNNNMSCPNNISLSRIVVDRSLPRGWDPANSLAIAGNLFREIRENGLTKCLYKTSTQTRQLTIRKAASSRPVLLRQPVLPPTTN